MQTKTTINVKWPVQAFFWVLLLLCSNCFAQSNPQRILSSFIYKSKAYNYEFIKESEDSYSLKLSTIEKAAAAAKADTTENNNSSEEKAAAKTSTDTNNNLFNSFEQNVFVGIFLNQMKGQFGADTSIQSLKDIGTGIYFKIKTRLDFVDDEPVTAYLILKKDSIHSFLSSNSSVYYNGRLSWLAAYHAVDRVTVETQDGAIKNITVRMLDTALVNQHAETPRQYIEFKNQYPISISGKFDAENFADVKLYCFNCAGITGLYRNINLSDLLSLDIVLENNKDDYSPVNSTVSVSPAKPIIELKKEKRSKIFEVAAFSDFVGMDQEQPNGLIQIEARRKVNINTQSWPLFYRAGNKDFASKYNLSKIEIYRINPGEQGYKDDSVGYKIYKRIKPAGVNADSPKLDSLRKQSIKIESMRQDSITYDVIKNNILAKAKLNNGLTRMDSLELELNKMYIKELDAARSNLNSVQNSPRPLDIVYIPKSKIRSRYWTAFGYIEPVLLFSKLEQTNRFIDSAKAPSNKINPLQLYQYQIASLGINVDVIKFSFPQEKLTWNFLHGGIYWFRTRVATSTGPSQQSVALNSNYWQAGTSVSFNPDSRWALTFGVNYIQPNLWNTDYTLTNNHALLQTFLDGSMKTSDDAKMFLRFRWTSEIGKHEVNFTQFQLGYSMNIFVKSGK